MAQPGFQFETAEDSRMLQAPGVRLAFRWLGDRWTHALEVTTSSSAPGWLRVACALEGDPSRSERGVVMSPAYQEIERHAFELGVRALLTGQSGLHHFSAVVTARDLDACVMLDFDLADRCRAPVYKFASTYDVPLDAADLIDAGPERIVWGGDALGSARLELIADSPTQLTLATSDPGVCRVQAFAQIDHNSFTNRCIYHWRWTPAGGLDSSL
jgi:hypothetical protein